MTIKVIFKKMHKSGFHLLNRNELIRFIRIEIIRIFIIAFGIYIHQFSFINAVIIMQFQ